MQQNPGAWDIFVAYGAIIFLGFFPLFAFSLAHWLVYFSSLLRMHEPFQLVAEAPVTRPNKKTA